MGGESRILILISQSDTENPSQNHGVTVREGVGQSPAYVIAFKQGRVGENGGENSFKEASKKVRNRLPIEEMHWKIE